MATSSSSSTSGSPCGACKFLRRKCASDCVFAPYFCSEQGPARFAAIHKVFGASNVSKLLTRVPVSHRYETVLTISYQAQARIRDPVYGCVAHIFALQQQVAYLQAQLIQLKDHLAQTLMIESRAIEINHDQFFHVFDDDRMNIDGIQSIININYPIINTMSKHYNSMSSNSLIMCTTSTNDSFESVDHHQYHHQISNVDDSDGTVMESSCRSDGSHEFSKKRQYSETVHLGELQAIALRMMRNKHIT